MNRDGETVGTQGDYFTRFFRWGSLWKVHAASDARVIDLDGQPCSNDEPGTPAPVVCHNRELYSSRQWCGLVRNEDSPWAQCIARLPRQEVQGNIIKQKDHIL